jgi:ribonuclease HI
LFFYISTKQVAKKQKYYVVWEGLKTGIYNSWEECRAQVFGFEGAKYKSFDTYQEALSAFGKDYYQVVTKSEKTNVSKSKVTQTRTQGIIKDSISTDAACSGNPGDMEYQCVETISLKPIFHQGPFKDGTNNIGEFLALVHALALLKKHNNNHTAIYTDSKTAISWVKNKKAKTTLERTKRNDEIFDLIVRAEQWLKTNTFANPILKWETELWGEIPADFGRK